MGNVVLDISMSLDGFVTAPGADREHGLGIGGEVLHEWVMDRQTPADAEVLDHGFSAAGAVLIGRRTFDFIDGPNGWQDDIGFGYEQDQSQAPPNFVVTHQAPTTTRLRSGFTFVTDGIDCALRQAQDAAGGKEVTIMGAHLGRQYLAAGAVDEVRIHLAPVLLRDGTLLFDRATTRPVKLEQTNVIVTDAATHLHYRVLG